MKPLISIVVPIYNSEVYLEECIESILGQIYDNLEIILVDDGSTDNSLEICNNYKKNDKRIRVIHQENQGNTFARKKGLAYAKGEYISFVDSDDFIKNDMIDLMVQKAVNTQSDIVISNYVIWKDNQEIKKPLRIKEGTYILEEASKEFYRNCFETDQNYGVLHNIWGKLYRTELYRRAQAEVEDSVTIGEDLVCIYAALQNVAKICIIDSELYYYRSTAGSLIRTHSNHRLADIDRVFNGIERISGTSGKRQELYDSCMKYLHMWTTVTATQLFKIKPTNMYLFPYQCIEKGSRVLLYGAGVIGQAYYKQMKEGKYCRLVGVIDKNYSAYNATEMDVYSIDVGLQLEYDVLLISVKDEKIAKQIKQELIERGVVESKVVWQIPLLLEGVKVYS